MSTTERLFRAACLAAVLLPLLTLAGLVIATVVLAVPGLDLSLLALPPGDGLLADLAGSVQLLVMAGAVALPVGIGAAIWLEEFARRSRLAPLVEAAVANLAAVPSVVYGLVGLAVFVRTLGLGRSLASGALTLSMVILPIVTLAALEALRAVPLTLREASLALGATRWVTVRRVVLPVALPGVLTGAILALARALGEGAALVVLGGFAYLSLTPVGPDAPLAAVPIRLFFWASAPNAANLQSAAAGVMVLLSILVVLGGVAVLLRHRAEKASR